MNRTECQKYWENPTDHNKAENYLDSPETLLRTSYLVHKIKNRFQSRATSILELGCNVGRNLNGLFSVGYHRLSGIDGNKHALELTPDAYPELFLAGTFHNHLLEDALPEIPDDSYDLVYTMAVLIHIHPDSEIIFEHMRRIAKKGIITIELEIPCKNPRIFTRDYQSVFERDNWKQRDSEIVGDKADAALSKYTYRLFKK